MIYPTSKTVDQMDILHGKKIADPYRWLEDFESPEAREWIGRQNALTSAFLEKISERKKIRDRLQALWNYEKFSLPAKRGNRYFHSYNDGLRNQSLWYAQDGIDGKPKLLLDPNALSKEGTVAVTAVRPNRSGSIFAYAVSEAGSDWMRWYFRDVDTGKDLPDVIDWVKFSIISWAGDDLGFYYSRYDKPEDSKLLSAANFNQKLYYHRLGEPQSRDKLIYERPDRKEWGFGAEVSEDGHFLVITVWKGTHTEKAVFVLDLRRRDEKPKPLFEAFDAEYRFIGNEGGIFYFITTHSAPGRKLIAVDIQNPRAESWRTVIPEDKASLQNVTHVAGKFFAQYLRDVKTEIRAHDKQGTFLGEVALPGFGTILGFGGRSLDKETFFHFSNWMEPGTVYHYDVESGKSQIFRKPNLEFDPADFEVRQVFYNSKDGTRVPMFLAGLKGFVDAGQHPAFLYGYGGFNKAMTPEFSPAFLQWMEFGGIVAVPNLRGGGEYGESWHLAGCVHNRQNVFDDFIGAAEWLINNKLTTPQKLAIGGGSNGGLLVGACMTQRPELFGAAVPMVGVLDMLRFHKFTIGWGWVSDYGCADNPEEFETLLAYSPLHNIKSGTTYPAALIMTGDHDDRVVPLHSYKFAAALQKAQSGENPILLRVDTDAGHGMGKPTGKQIDAFADRWAFLVKTFGIQVK